MYMLLLVVEPPCWVPKKKNDEIRWSFQDEFLASYSWGNPMEISPTTVTGLRNIKFHLVNGYGKSPLLMGKITISTGPFSIAMLVITRGYWLVVFLEHDWILFPFQLGMSSSQVTNSYFSEGWRKTTNQVRIVHDFS